MTAATPIVGVGGVVVHQGRALLIRRGKPPFLNRWMIPGGAVELGETLRDALLREMREETGLLVEPLRVLAVLDQIGREAGRVLHHYVLVDYLCRWVSGEVQAGSDALEVAWVGVDEMDGYSLPPQARTVVKAALPPGPARDEA